MRAPLIALALLSGCAMSHPLDGAEDLGVSDLETAPLDATTTSPDAGPAPVAPGAPARGVECGPNRCLLGEVCCNAACGVCAFEEECVDRGCL